MAFKTAIDEGQDLSDDLKIINQKIRENSKDIQNFCNATGYRRDRFREQVGGKTSVGHGSENDLTYFHGSGKIKDNKSFKEIKISHSIEEDLKAVNPKYDAKNPLFSRNCQRCVCTYEAKRRGFDVVVKPAVKNGVDNLATIDLNKGFPSVFKNSNVIDINGAFGSSVKTNIEKQMQQFGDGSRAIIAVHWKTNNGGHVFMAEQVNGKTLFVDPQNGDIDVSRYFKLIKTNPFKPCSYLMRTDNLEFTKKIKDCCEGK